jgi:flagellar protein FliO/FliZ
MDLLALLARVVLSLAVVLALLWFAARALRKNQQRSSHGVEVDVLVRQPLAQRSSLAVVQVGDRALVLGVTESRVELLAETSLKALASPAPAFDVQVSSVDGQAVELPTGVVTAQRVPRPQGGLAGSALSPATWAKAIDAVREMTVRR